MSESGRAAHLRETADLLWTGDFRAALERVSRAPASDLVDEYLVLAGTAGPRLVLPGPARTAAAVVGQLPTDGSLSARARGRLLELVLRGGLARVAVRDRLRVYGPGAAPAHAAPARASITDHLTTLFGRPVRIAMPVTRPRANRKPVLRVVGRDGETVGFVKVGTNPLTQDLVRREAEVLTRLAESSFTHVVLPEVLARHAWEGLELLVLAPLPTTRLSSVPPPELMLAAAMELASVPAVVDRPLTGSPYWRRLRDRLLARTEARAVALVPALDRLGSHVGTARFRFGSWHGDWAPWNMAAHEGRVLVWDLERFEPDVPVGLDLVHHDLGTRILVPGRDPGEVVAARFARADALLAPLGVPSDQAPVVFAVYLLEIAARWLEDGQAEAGVGDRLVDGVIRSAAGAVDQVVSRAHPGRDRLAAEP